MFIEFSWKAKRFAFAAFLRRIIIIHHFLENLEHKNIFQTNEKLMQFS